MRKDGTRFWANAVINAIHDASGELVGFAKITRDSSERRNVEEQLRQAQKMEAVGQLTGGVAHDFNNLLVIILGNLETLLRQLDRNDLDTTRMRRVSENALRGAQRAASLTQRLLAFARRQPLEPKPVDVNRLVANMSELLRRTLGEQITIETVLAGGLWHTHTDPNQLESAMLNLAVNSRDAMPDGGKLTIETANAHLDRDYSDQNAEVVPGQYVALAITDNGCGIGKDVLRARVRAVLHDQGHRPGHGSRSVAGLRVRQAVRRTRQDLQRARRRHDRAHLSAATAGGHDGAQRAASARGTASRAAHRKRSSSSRTTTTCASIRRSS